MPESRVVRIILDNMAVVMIVGFKNRIQIGPSIKNINLSLTEA